MPRFVVWDVRAGEALPGFPSPFLIEQGGGDAYTDQPESDNPYWYAKVPGRYESKDGEYKRVRIRHLDDYTVVLNVAPRDESVHESEWPDEYTAKFENIEALSAIDAETEARKRAMEEVRNYYGDEATALILVVQTRKENW